LGPKPQAKRGQECARVSLCLHRFAARTGGEERSYSAASLLHAAPASALRSQCQVLSSRRDSTRLSGAIELLRPRRAATPPTCALRACRAGEARGSSSARSRSKNGDDVRLAGPVRPAAPLAARARSRSPHPRADGRDPGDPARTRPVGFGADGFRQDGCLRAAHARSAGGSRAVAGARRARVDRGPHPRAGRADSPGDHALRPPPACVGGTLRGRGGRGARAAAAGTRRRSAAARRHARPPARPRGQERTAPVAARDPGARRGRPPALARLLRAAGGAALAAARRQPALVVLRHLSTQGSRAGREAAARPLAHQPRRRRHAHHRRHRAAPHRGRRRPAHAAPPALARAARVAAGARLRCEQTRGRRAGTLPLTRGSSRLAAPRRARARCTHPDARRLQGWALSGARGDRPRGPRPRHRAATRGGELRSAALGRRLHASHRAHRSGRRAWPRAQLRQRRQRGALSPDREAASRRARARARLGLRATRARGGGARRKRRHQGQAQEQEGARLRPAPTQAAAETGQRAGRA
jgi:hypothetical protein